MRWTCVRERANDKLQRQQEAAQAQIQPNYILCEGWTFCPSAELGSRMWALPDALHSPRRLGSLHMDEAMSRRPGNGHRKPLVQQAPAREERSRVRMLQEVDKVEATASSIIQKL